MATGCCCSADVYTVRDWLFGCVNFAVPDDAVMHILAERQLDPELSFYEVEHSLRELLKADLFVWVCMGPSKVSSTSDSDNGWSHSEGGYTLSDDDKDRMLAYAKAIYEKNGETFAYDDTVSISIGSFGIQPSDYDECGIPVPHIEAL